MADELSILTYAAAKGYTDSAIAGGGAIKGKNCVISSIEDVTGGHRVTFTWTLDNGTVRSDSMVVMDGETPNIQITNIEGGHRITITTDGVSQIVDVMDGTSPTVTVKEDTEESYVLTITTEDSSFDTPNLKASGKGVPEGGTAGQILVKASDDDFDTEWVDGGEATELTNAQMDALKALL